MWSNFVKDKLYKKQIREKKVKCLRETKNGKPEKGNNGITFETIMTLNRDVTIS